MPIRINFYVVLCGGHSSFRKERECPPRVSAIRRSALLERHRHVGRERLVLPLVAGRLVEADLDRVGAALTGLERPEVDAAGQRGHGDLRLVRGVGQRRDRTGGSIADAHLEQRQVGVRTGVGLGVADRRAELDVGRDRSGVLDRERVHLGAAGGQVGVVQRERAGVVGVAQLDGQVRRVDGDVARVAGREVSATGVDRSDQCCTGDQCDRTTDDGVADGAVAVRGHNVPFLWLGHLVVPVTGLIYAARKCVSNLMSLT